MNRMIFVLAAGLACTGCAASVEGAQPEPEATEPQREPPKKPFAGAWANPYENLLPNVDEVRRDVSVPLRQPPHFPDPDPNVER